MKNFDELFKESEIISDKRNSVFNRLIEKTENEIIPAFAKMLERYQLKTAYFTTLKKPFLGGIEPQTDFDGDDFWAFGINKDGLVLECQKDLQTDRYVTIKEYRLQTDTEHDEYPVINFTKVGIKNIAVKLNNRVEQLNKKYEQDTANVEVLLSKTQ